LNLGSTRTEGHFWRTRSGAGEGASLLPDGSGICRISRPRELKVSTLWLQYPSATNTCPELATATAVGWHSLVGPLPGWNRFPRIRAGRVSPCRNCNMTTASDLLRKDHNSQWILRKCVEVKLFWKDRL